MQDFAAAIAEALRLIAGFDANLAEIVILSLKVSISATILGAAIGLPLGALIAIASFPGRALAILLINAMMGLPPVVVGLIVYLMLSNAGPMGGFGLLYSPTAMVIAQTVLVTPIIAALARQTIEDLRSEYDEQLRALGVGPLRAVPDTALGRPLQPAHRLPRGFRASRSRSRCRDHRRRKYQSCDTGHDDRHCARNLQGRSGAGPGARADPACHRHRHQRGGAGSAGNRDALGLCLRETISSTPTCATDAAARSCRSRDGGSPSSGAAGAFSTASTSRSTDTGTLVLIGPNGAGKSLLVRVLAGLVQPTAGRVSWAGSLPDRRRAPRIGFVFQRPVLLRRSVLANIEYALAVAGVGARAIAPGAPKPRWSAPGSRT